MYCKRLTPADCLFAVKCTLYRYVLTNVENLQISRQIQVGTNVDTDIKIDVGIDVSVNVDTDVETDVDTDLETDGDSDVKTSVENPWILQTDVCALWHELV